ncbi:AfsR/SARP family transcriptional regulator [Streptomyces sp. NPDC088560]|uniref:AfsR/SARP family transcriptional regulator n=1 Tax=Streptomyces sp. NPDC088560 TaxID=3365868 RepID=UPI003818E464
MAGKWNQDETHPSSSSLYVTLLGPLRITHLGREIDVGSPQQRAVLLALLLAKGRSVTVGQLVAAVWGEDPPNGAISTVRTYISRLRKTFEGDKGAESVPHVIAAADGGYALRSPGGISIDMAEVEVQYARARAFYQSGKISVAAELLKELLDAWQGVPFSGVPGPLAEAERARLGEWYMRMLQSRLEFELELGRHHDLTAELIALCREFPLREGFRALLMLAFYRCGRQAEALAVYHDARQVLRTELGVEPGHELSALYAKVLAADPSLGAPGWDEFGLRVFEPSREEQPGDKGGLRGNTTNSLSAANPTQPHVRGGAHTTMEAASRTLVTPHQLPTAMPGFTGRLSEMHRAQSVIAKPEGTRVLTVNGMAGVGKTAFGVKFAHSVAHLFPQGQLYVDLRGYDSAGAVDAGTALRAFLLALGIPPDKIPAELDAQSALYRSVLSDKQLLILLDNARDSEQVRPLLPGPSDCLVIVTARHQLPGLVATHGAHPIILDVLDDREALSLLSNRIGDARVSADLEAAQTIIQHCGRLPLALSIVAARARTYPDFSLSLIAEELKSVRGSLDAFSSGDTGLDARVVFSWSLEVLSPEAALLFRLLALHPGPQITVSAAASLAGLEPRETRSLLVELVRAYLIAECAPSLFQMHDLLRVYAAELSEELDTSEVCGGAVERLFDYFLHSGYSACSEISAALPDAPATKPAARSNAQDFQHETQARAWLDLEHDSLLAAVEVMQEAGYDAHAWQLACYVAENLSRRACWIDLASVLENGLAAAERVNDSHAQALCHRGLGIAHGKLGRNDDAVWHLLAALNLFIAKSNLPEEAEIHGHVAVVEMQRGNLKEALKHADEAHRIYREMNEPLRGARSRNDVGRLYALLGDYERALAYCSGSIDELEKLKDIPSLISAYNSMAFIYRQKSDFKRALQYHESAYRMACDARDTGSAAETLAHIGELQRAAGMIDAARTAWSNALRLFEELEGAETEVMRTSLRRLLSEVNAA